jgi:hypothetical protein
MEPLYMSILAFLRVMYLPSCATSTAGHKRAAWE